MKTLKPLRGATVLLTLLMLTGCGSPDRAPHIAPPPALPEWPADCATPTPHAALTVGADAVSTLKRERGQLNVANAKAANCTAFYGDLRKGGL